MLATHVTRSASSRLACPCQDTLDFGAPHSFSGATGGQPAVAEARTHCGLRGLCQVCSNHRTATVKQQRGHTPRGGRQAKDRRWPQRIYTGPSASTGPGQAVLGASADLTG